jgi:hypothetical protein
VTYHFFQSGIKYFDIKKINYFLVDTLIFNTTQIKNSDSKWSDNEDEVNCDAMNTEEECSHTKIINQCDFGQRISLMHVYPQTLPYYNKKD